MSLAVDLREKERKKTIKGVNPTGTDIHRKWKEIEKRKKKRQEKENKQMGGDAEYPKRKSTGAGNWRNCDVKSKCYFPEIKAESGNTIITWTQIYKKLQAHGTGRSLWHTLIHHCCGEEKPLWDLSGVCKRTIWFKRNCGHSLAKMVTDRMFREGGFLPSCFGDIQIIHFAIHFL